MKFWYFVEPPFILFKYLFEQKESIKNLTPNNFKGTKVLKSHKIIWMCDEFGLLTTCDIY